MFEFAFGRSFVKKGASIFRDYCGFCCRLVGQFVRFHCLENSPTQLTYTTLWNKTIQSFYPMEKGGQQGYGPKNSLKSNEFLRTKLFRNITNSFEFS